MTRGYVDVGHGQMHYRRIGDGDDAIVLLHQAPSSSMMWESLAPVLAGRGYDVLALDLPGHGGSDPWPTEPGLEDYADAVAQSLDGLGLRRYNLLGHHTGCAVSLVLSLRNPGRVAKLIGWGIPLLSTTVRAELANEQPPLYAADAVEVVRCWRSFWEEATPASQPRAVVRSMAEMLLTDQLRPLAHRAVGRADLTHVLEQLAVPMLALAGKGELLRAQTEEAAALSRFIQFEEFGDAGTYVADDEPDALALRVDSFLRTGLDRADYLEP